MIFDAIPFRKLLYGSTIKEAALRAFTERVEQKLGVEIVRDARTVPYGRPDLIEPFRRAVLLKEHGIITEFGRVYRVADEPPTKAWYTVCNVDSKHQTGGTSWDNDVDAFYAALSEGLERYIWMTQDDYFVNPTVATCAEIEKIGPYIEPRTITGYSADQRAEFPERILRPDAKYLWIQGDSLTNGSKIFLPAQVVTGMNRRTLRIQHEPIIRQQNTNGLATWPTRPGAQLAGLMEVIEREAYMIMWLNQLTLPRIALTPLIAKSPSLARAIAKCEQYRFKTHVVQLPTDAPAHAVAVVLEDLSGNSPRFSFGIRAHRSLSAAIEKSMCEALRGFRSYHLWKNAGNSWDNTTPVHQIGHRERLHFWGVPENAKHLEFMVQGEETVVGPKPWDTDSIDEHLERTLQWCREHNFDVISVPLTGSAKNPTDLHIEMVVVPAMMPTYLHEASQQFGGTRWREVPAKLGFTARDKPFADRPHPFS